MAKLKTKNGAGWAVAADFAQMDSRITALEADMAEVQDSLSPAQIVPEPNTNIANYSAYSAFGFRLGRTVVLNFFMTLSKATNFSSSSLVLLTMPAHARPSEARTLYRAAEAIRWDGTVYGPNAFRQVEVNTNGKVAVNLSGREGVGAVKITLNYAI